MLLPCCKCVALPAAAATVASAAAAAARVCFWHCTRVWLTNGLIVLLPHRFAFTFGPNCHVLVLALCCSWNVADLALVVAAALTAVVVVLLLVVVAVLP